MIHRFSADAGEDRNGPGNGDCQEDSTAGAAALDELQFRRKGLAASLLVIGLALVAVFFKIKQIERPKE